jgi:hypothetical protein
MAMIANNKLGKKTAVIYVGQLAGNDLKHWKRGKSVQVKDNLKKKKSRFVNYTSKGVILQVTKITRYSSVFP